MAIDGGNQSQSHKSHRSRQAGPSAKRKSKSNKKSNNWDVAAAAADTDDKKQNQRQHNPKVVFVYNQQCLLSMEA